LHTPRPLMLLLDSTRQSFHQQLHDDVLSKLGVIEIGIDLDYIGANQFVGKRTALLATAMRNVARSAIPVETQYRLQRTNGQTKRLLMRTKLIPDSRNTTAVSKNSGPLITQCRVRFLLQFAAQPIAIARRIVVADNEWRGLQ
jgi:hypothetical protein